MAVCHADLCHVGEHDVIPLWPVVQVVHAQEALLLLQEPKYRRVQINPEFRPLSCIEQTMSTLVPSGVPVIGGTNGTDHVYPTRKAYSRVYPKKKAYSGVCLKCILEYTDWRKPILGYNQSRKYTSDYAHSRKYTSEYAQSRKCTLEYAKSRKCTLEYAKSRKHKLEYTQRKTGSAW